MIKRTFALLISFFQTLLLFGQPFGLDSESVFNSCFKNQSTAIKILINNGASFDTTFVCPPDSMVILRVEVINKKKYKFQLSYYDELLVFQKSKGKVDFFIGKINFRARITRRNRIKSLNFMLKSKKYEVEFTNDGKIKSINLEDSNGAEISLYVYKQISRFLLQ